MFIEIAVTYYKFYVLGLSSTSCFTSLKFWWKCNVLWSFMYVFQNNKFPQKDTNAFPSFFLFCFLPFFRTSFLSSKYFYEHASQSKLIIGINPPSNFKIYDQFSNFLWPLEKLQFCPDSYLFLPFLIASCDAVQERELPQLG